MLLDDFFDKEYWVVDFLPQQVPENAGGKFFRVEQYYLEPLHYTVLREQFSDILLKLYCYYDLRLFVNGDTEGIVNPEPEWLVNNIKDNQGDLCILIGVSEALISLNRNDTHMTVFSPSEDFLELIRTLSGAFGLFAWKPNELEETKE